MRNNFCIRKTAAENIQRRTDGIVHFSPALFLDQSDIIKIADASGVHAVHRGVVRQDFQQFAVNTAAFAFDIDGMDEKFRTVISEFFQCFRSKFKCGEFLPEVGDDKVSAFNGTAAGKVEYQPVSTGFF